MGVDRKRVAVRNCRASMSLSSFGSTLTSGFLPSRSGGVHVLMSLAIYFFLLVVLCCVLVVVL
ncbi:hypothetical protein AVDCRST_MAG94-2448 [uncultured Leptolyngbya sp.]|uniref:Transmembrane protein n=1 Tax=uncultured Leptolyngbya sp. TaxID=332963 RepID=A0A6J4LWW5_9CYAN|nr:hypothetical protein AVDCRST_MAG94-2448 [uncultured Leptolyngbya sp.]